MVEMDLGYEVIGERGSMLPVCAHRHGGQSLKRGSADRCLIRAANFRVPPPAYAVALR
jgi:hypothetical protein